MIHWIGRKYKKFRIFYYNLTGRWHWGIIGAINTPECFPEIKPDEDKEFEDYLKQIFS